MGQAQKGGAKLMLESHMGVAKMTVTSASQFKSFPLGHMCTGQRIESWAWGTQYITLHRIGTGLVP